MPEETHCPLCATALEEREVAPCEECGGFPLELEHFRAGRHSYAEYEVFGGLRLVLCNFCDANFSTFDPVFFGLPRNAPCGHESMRHVLTVKPAGTSRDRFCPSCRYRLAFLRFVMRARARHGAAQPGNS